MAADRDRHLLLLLFLLVPLSDGSPRNTSQHALQSSPTTTVPLRPRGNAPHGLNSDDYYEEFDVDPTEAPGSVPTQATDLEPCDYDRCLDEQTPCHLLASAHNCLCPGLSPRLEPPEPPALHSLSQNASGVVVHWCAPYSYVTSYKVTVGAGKAVEFGQRTRKGSIGEVPRGVEVCVLAVNGLGDSPPGEGSCRIFQPREDGSLGLKIGLIGGALGLLLLLSLALLLWRLRTRRKAGARISTHDTTESL